VRAGMSRVDLGAPRAFENGNRTTGVDKHVRGRQSGNAAADYDHVDIDIPIDFLEGRSSS